MMTMRGCGAVAAALLMSGAVAVRAQTPAQTQAPKPPPQPRASVAFTSGASFGYASSIGGEASMRLAPTLDLILAGAHVWNLTPADVAARALTIANAVGATATTTVHANVFDLGFRLYIPALGGRYVQPYGLAGGGLALLHTKTVFDAGSGPTDADALGIQLGRDLAGTTVKPSLLIGAGTVVTPSRRLFIDLGVRYDRIFARPSQIPNDQVLNAVRLQVGAGLRF